MPIPFPLSGGYSPAVLGNFAQALNDYTTLSSVSSMPTGGAVSRSGNAMLYDSTGKLTYAPNNTALYSQDWSNWTADGANVTSTNNTAPDGSSTATLLTAASGSNRRYKTTTFTVGTAYIFSIYVKQGTAATVQTDVVNQVAGPIFTFSTQTYVGGVGVSNHTVTPIGSTGWYRLSFKLTASVANIGPGIAMNGATVGDTVYVWGQQAEPITYQTTPSTYVATTTSAYYGPRFDYDPATLAAKGLLVEGARTNTQTYSEQFDNATGWTPSNVTVSANATTAPDGTSNADKIIPTTASAGHTILSALTFAASTVYAFSAYAKASGYNFFTINEGGAAAYGANFNLNTGVVTSGASIISASMTPVGNGWYRCVMVASTAGSTQIRYYVNTTSTTGADTYAGDGTSGIFLWGAQAEIANFPSSYIPTVASSLARAAETFTLTGYTNRLVESFYIDEQTGLASSYNVNASATSPLTVIDTGTTTTYGWGWLTSLRAYTNAYAGDIATPSWIDNTGTTGNRMYYDSTGALTWAPANLAQQSQTFNNVYWTKASVTVSADATSAPDGTTTADNVISTVGTGEQRIYANPIPSAVGIRYTYSVYAKTNGVNWLVMRDDARGFADTSFDLVNGVVGTVGANRTASILSVGNGWYRCAVTVEVSASWVVGNMSFCLADVDNGRATFVGNGVKSVYLWGAQVEPVTYQTSPRAYIPTTASALYLPRYDYDPSVTPATPRGMLIEESRSNLLTYSQPTVTGWSTSAVTGAITFNSGDVLVPTGQASKAAKLAATATSYLNQALTFSATTYSYTFYAKSGAENTVLRPQVYDGVTDHSCLVNLTTLVVSSLTNLVGTPKVSSVGNGWYRIEIVFTVAGATTGEARLGVLGAGTAYFYGAQLEVGSFSTSYMGDTTTGSPPATRAADVVKLSGSALTTLQGSNWTSAVEFSAIAFKAFARIGPDFDGFKSAAYMQADDYGRTLGDASSTMNVFIPSSGTFSSGANIRFAYAQSAEGRSAFINNGTLAADTGKITGVTVSYLGCNVTEGNQLNGRVRSMALYNQRLPNAILKQKSTVGSPY